MGSIQFNQIHPAVTLAIMKRSLDAEDDLLDEPKLKRHKKQAKESANTTNQLKRRKNSEQLSAFGDTSG